MIAAALLPLFFARPVPSGDPDVARPDAAAIDALVREVSALRGIPARGRIAWAVIDKAEARERVTALVRREYAGDQALVEGRMLERLGLLPPGTDYLGLYVDFVARELAGFYDPAGKRLYVADWIPMAAQRPTLAHEIGHALQDQRFGLEALVAPARGATDAQLARLALAEGDATAIMIEELDPTGTLTGSRLLTPLLRTTMTVLLASMDGAPAYLRETLAFPYVEGLEFVMTVRRTRPWSAVDALWKRPPESTEQILHPEKYERRESPVAIAAQVLPGLLPELRLAGVDTLGELAIRIWLAQSARRAESERAAAGWAGDRVAVYLPAGASGAAGAATLAWLTAWDSDADAADFAEVARQRLDALRGEAGSGFALERQGTSVALVLGAPKSAVALCGDVLRTWKVGKR